MSKEIIDAAIGCGVIAFVVMLAIGLPLVFLIALFMWVIGVL